MPVGEAGGPEPRWRWKQGNCKELLEVDPGVTERVDVGQRGIQKMPASPPQNNFPSKLSHSRW